MPLATQGVQSQLEAMRRAQRGAVGNAQRAGQQLRAKSVEVAAALAAQKTEQGRKEASERRKKQQGKKKQGRGGGGAGRGHGEGDRVTYVL